MFLYDKLKSYKQKTAGTRKLFWDRGLLLALLSTNAPGTNLVLAAGSGQIQPYSSLPPSRKAQLEPAIDLASRREELG